MPKSVENTQENTTATETVEVTDGRNRAPRRIRLAKVSRASALAITSARASRIGTETKTKITVTLTEFQNSCDLNRIR